MRGGRAWRRERSGEQVVDVRAGRVAHRSGRLDRQRSLVVRSSLHHVWSMYTVTKVVVVVQDSEREVLGRRQGR